MTRFALNRQVSFLLFMVLGVALQAVPGLAPVLKWYETFFHEISHALAAVLTGGVADDLVLRLDGSGQVMVGGGARPLTAFAGYAGATVWGCAVYVMASAVGDAAARWFALVFAGGCALVVLLWVSLADVVTLAIVAVICGSMLLLAWRRLARLARPALRLIGAHVAGVAMVTPTYILSAGGRHNDASALRAMLLMPEIVWVGAWLVFGALCIALTWRLEGIADRRAAAGLPLPGTVARPRRPS